MNSKKNKNQPWIKCPNASHDPEVLVLPPDILEKLGINLGSLQHSKEISHNKEILKEIGHESNKSTTEECIDTCHDNKSSILETASLMKESVLLSPTFNTVKSDVDSNEMKLNPANKHENLNEIPSKSKQLMVDNINGNHSNYEVNAQNNAEIPEIDMETSKTGTHTQHKVIVPGVGEVTLENVSNDIPSSKYNLNKKINIISQEVLVLEEKNNLKYLKPSEIMIPHNKIIDKHLEQKSTIPVIEKGSMNNFLSKEINLDKTSKEIKNDCENIKLSDLDKINRREPNESDSITEKELIQDKQHNSHINLINKEVELNSYNNLSTKLPTKESLGCTTKGHNSKLRTYSYSHQQNQNVPASVGFDNLQSNLNGIHNKEIKIYKDKKINSEGNIATSKLSIQGVEKPGGNNKFVKDQYIRTYSKRPKSKVTNSSILTLNSSEDNLEIGSSDVTLKESCDLAIEQNLCVCEDYGRISFCNYDLNYEHIHFWCRKPVCSFELLCSIYDDIESAEINRPVEITESEVIFQLDDNLPDDSYFGSIICCNNIENMYKNIDLDILFPKLKPAHNEQSIDIDNENVTVNILNNCVNICNSDVSDKSLDISPNKNKNVDEGGAVNSEERQQLSIATYIPYKENVITSDKPKKRKRSTTISESDKPSPSPKRNRNADRIVCGVCKAKVPNADWKDHVSSEHDFIAWKDGEKDFDMEDKTLFKNLETRLSETGKIICTFCDKEVFDVNEFIAHVKICSYWRFTRNHQIMCGVCNTEVEKTVWIEHICKEHNYLAWEVGEPPLDLSDKDKITIFLNITSKAIGGLECSECGIIRKSTKCFIRHLKKCANIDILSPDRKKKTFKRLRRDCDVKINKRKKIFENNTEDTDTTVGGEEDVADNVTIKCGVCQSEVDDDKRWIEHIRMQHNYIAWKESEIAVDINNEKEVHDHLYAMSKRQNGLICAKCGLRRKYVKAFLKHIDVCDGSIQHDTTFNDTVNESCASDLNVTESALNESEDNNNEEETIECGVCHQQMQGKHWIKHIQTDHSYIAWKEGDTPINVDDETEVHDHLYAISKRQEGLTCAKCGLRRKYVKSFLTHINICDGSVQHDSNVNDSRVSDLNVTEQSLNESMVDDNDDEDTIECGVCHETMLGKEWVAHIQAEHSYVAWKEGRTPITDEKQINDHLYVLSKRLEGLTCAKCGLRRKYVKSFLSHVKECDGIVQNESVLNETVNGSFATEYGLSETNNDDELENVECGVCHQHMPGKSWHQHIQKEHAYLAWKEGDKPVDFTIEQNVNCFLYFMSKKYDGLICSKCGLVRKYVKVFLSHMQTCDSTAYMDYPVTTDGLQGDACKCGVCGELVELKRWKSHAMLTHYNLAWRVGEYPIDAKNPYLVEKYLKEYKNKYKKFVCSLCGLVRVSCIGFYAHILQCGKTEEELEPYKLYCDICNSKYLCLYKNQHLTMHREQELAKERKFEAKKLEPKEELLLVGEGRMAAKKARNVMEKYKSYEFNCTTCGYGADEEKELEEHSCRKILYMDLSDSENSIKVENESSTEDEESDGDSNVSDIEVKAEKKKKHSESISAASKIKRIPFAVKHPKSYLQQAALEYFNAYLPNNETLYPLWKECRYEIVSETEISKYTPPLEESCNFKISSEDWHTLKKFEATRNHGVSTIFVGSSIQCIAWSAGGHVAVSTHGAADAPRLRADRVLACRSLLQLWEIPNNGFLPNFVLGMAHEYGLVWGMDWCPSGTTDVLNVEEQKSFARLGLLAIACSNGCAYILSVPYPSSIIDSDNKIYKLHPVAELKLSRGDQIFQATSISWSSQSGHATVLVGYSNGTTALYDLSSESPLLMDKKEDVVTFYPYHDEKTHNTCVTGVTTFPLKFSRTELVSSACPTGAEMQRRGAAAARLRTHLASSAALHAPHWPALLLAENDSIVNQAINELDWWCVGRRLGAMNSCAGCLHCGALAAYSPPAVKLMRPHPVYSELNKDAVAIIHMVSLDKKVSKQKNDDFAVKLEPLTYNDVIKSYGVELKFAKDLDKRQLQNLYNKEQCPERFPLCDIPSLAFNPAARHHRQLAMATHSGLVFFIHT